MKTLLLVRSQAFVLFAFTLVFSRFQQAYAQDPCDGYDTYNTIDASACTQYVTPDNQYLSTSGTYYSIIQNQVGCDSIITINLTIWPSQPDTYLTLSECDGYTSGSGMVYNTPGNYTEYLQTINGCDSIVHLNLSLKKSTHDTVYPATCDTYTAPDGQLYSSSGDYYAIIPNSIGCDSIIIIYLTVNPLPIVPVTVQGNAVEAGAGFSNFEWIDCGTGQVIAGQHGQQLFPQSGSYAVVASDASGCRDTSACIAITVVGLHETEGSATLQLYPNPGTQHFSIRGLKSQTAWVLVQDIHGKTVLTFENATESEALNLDRLEAGTYFITVQEPSARTSLRFVKH